MKIRPEGSNRITIENDSAIITDNTGLNLCNGLVSTALR